MNQEQYYTTMRLILLMSFLYIENTAENLNGGKITKIKYVHKYFFYSTAAAQLHF